VKQPSNNKDTTVLLVLAVAAHDDLVQQSTSTLCWSRPRVKAPRCDMVKYIERDTASSFSNSKCTVRRSLHWPHSFYFGGRAAHSKSETTNQRRQTSSNDNGTASQPSQAGGRSIRLLGCSPGERYSNAPLSSKNKLFTLDSAKPRPERRAKQASVQRGRGEGSLLSDAASRQSVRRVPCSLRSSAVLQAEIESAYTVPILYARQRVWRRFLGEHILHNENDGQ